MSKYWDYAIHSQEVRAAGGPDAYKALLYQSGHTAGQAEMFPYCFLAGVGGCALGALVTVLVNQWQKKQLAKADAMRREAEEGLSEADEMLSSEATDKSHSGPEETVCSPSGPNQETDQTLLS